VNESGGSLVFNSKQLEELENIHDSTGAFEEEAEDSGQDESVGDGAMEWRRGLLEEASENVKRARARPVDADMTYEISSLLFDRESGRFARVNRSVPGYLRIVYLTGGDREYGLLDVHGYLKEYAANKKLSELALQLGMSEAEVDSELDTLGLTALEDPEEEAAAEEAAAEPAKGKGKGDTKAKGKGKAAAAAPAPAPAAKEAKPKGKRAKKPPPPLAKGKKANPIDDPNSFIRQNFMEMSNRELARHTGLSEHTIRRKLGEWGLKRKKKGK
jgi:hypothetical protein